MGPTITAEIVTTDRRTVACDGGAGSFGHPRVFMTVIRDRVMCPYCSRIYVLRPGVRHDGEH